MSGPAVVHRCRLPALLLLAAAVLAGTAEAQIACQAGWLQHSTHCYLYKNTPLTYTQSSQDCIISNAHLVTISSPEEDAFLMEDVFTQQQEAFWIGLNDQTTEGQFKWEEDGEFLLTTSYSNWDPASPTNQRGRDCVVYGAHGWRLESNFCANVKHTYVCRQALSAVMGEALTATPPTGLDAGAIVAIIIVIVVLLVLVVLAVVLVLLWKYCNDTFNVYICPCLNRKTTRSRVHSLEQENQRLRQELSQLKMARPDKLSMSFSRDSFDLGAMGSAPASPIHPRPSVVGPNQPPPLQRVLPSKIAPATPGMGPPRLQPVPPIFTRQGSQGSGFPRLSLPSPPNAARFTLQPPSQRDPVTEDPQGEAEGEEEEEEEDEGSSDRLVSPA